MTTVAATPPATAPRLSFAAAVTDALDTALALDDSVWLLGEDIGDPTGGVFGVTKGLQGKHGADRVRATPISEQAIIGAAIGSAIAGMRPVAEIMLFDFFAVCMDQIANHAGKLRYMSGGKTSVPMTIRTSCAAGQGSGAQHSQALEAWLLHTPGIKVVFPSTPSDAKGLLLSSIFDNDPVVFVEHASNYFSVREPVPTGDYRVPLGKARVARPGSDVTVITYGKQVHDCVKAATALADGGPQVEVIDLRTIVPLDWETVLASVARTRRAVIVHEAVRTGGVGAEIAAHVTESLFGQLDAPVLRVGAPSAPMPAGKSLETAYLPSVDSITRAIQAALDYKSR